MLFPVLLIALVVAAANGSKFFGPKKEVTDHDGPITLGHNRFASLSEFVESGGRCGTKSHTEAEMFEVAQKLATVPRLAPEDRAKNVATVPVHFHIIRGANNEGAVSADEINAQMDVMNAAFAKANFNFVLRSTTTTKNAAWFHAYPGSQEEAAMKARLRVGGANALNVYTGTNNNTLLGWAYFPSEYRNYPTMDGVVLHSYSLPGGSFAPFNLGATLVHEAGHWMGLYHTFEGGCRKLATMGDQVSDTPCVKKANYGCPSLVDSCPGDTLQYKGNDLVHNYMDYVNDACMWEFTPGQVERMRQSWIAYRRGQ